MVPLREGPVFHKGYTSYRNPFLYGWMNDNFQKEFRILLPCLLTVFSGGGGGDGGVGKRRGIETTVCVNPMAVAPTTAAETIRLHQLRAAERNGCRNDEEKVLVEVTLDHVGHHHNVADTDADD